MSGSSVAVNLVIMTDISQRWTVPGLASVRLTLLLLRSEKSV